MTPDNPFAPPKTEVADIAQPANVVRYAGFWIRVLAALIDSVLIVIVTYPILIAIYGWAYVDGGHSGFVAGPADFVLTWIAPAAASIVFWVYRQATPGKMAVSARIVDARTGGALTLGQSLLRYAGYFVALLPLGLGILWVAFDARKQGWHDKLAKTVVVRGRRSN